MSKVDIFVSRSKGAMPVKSKQQDKDMTKPVVKIVRLVNFGCEWGDDRMGTDFVGTIALDDNDGSDA